LYTLQYFRCIWTSGTFRNIPIIWRWLGPVEYFAARIISMES